MKKVITGQHWVGLVYLYRLRHFHLYQSNGILYTIFWMKYNNQNNVKLNFNP